MKPRRLMVLLLGIAVSGGGWVMQLMDLEE